MLRTQIVCSGERVLGQPSLTKKDKNDKKQKRLTNLKKGAQKREQNNIKKNDNFKFNTVKFYNYTKVIERW